MLKVDSDIKLDFDDVLLVPQRSAAASRKQVELKRTFKFYHSPKEWHGVPLMAANMDTTGTFKMGASLNNHEAITCLHKHYSVEDIEGYFKYYNIEPNVWVSVGMNVDREMDRLKGIQESMGFSPNICIDIANGYTEKFVDWCADIRFEFPDSIIMAGNVATSEMVSELILHGEVDIVKVGIGPGSACTTRLKAGVGYPQLSAIAECSHVAHGLRSDTGRLGLICADGGCRYPADVAKAYAAGADFVMLGGMLAGTKECEGEWVEKAGTKYLTFYGMSSKKAQEKHGDGLLNYRSSEGRVKKIPYKGEASVVINDILGGVRSACAYTGATSLKDFSKTARFVRVNRTHHDLSVEKL
tara:strand:- start:1734 stop:2801 length:1068 start_codon:yes stop_codon:yes gene_type:complete